MKRAVSAIAIFILVVITASCTSGTSGSSGPASGNGDPYSLINASFESGLSGWTTTDIMLGTDGIIFITNEATDGVQALAIQLTNNGAAGVAQHVAYQTGKTYVLSASIKDAIPNYKNILLELCDSSSNNLIPRYYTNVRIQSWVGWMNTNLTLAGTNLTGHIKVVFYIEKNVAGTPELIVDGVVLSNY